MKPSPKVIDERVSRASAFAAEQAARRGETAAETRRQAAHAAEATFQQLKGAR